MVRSVSDGSEDGSEVMYFHEVLSCLPASGDMKMNCRTRSFSQLHVLKWAHLLIWLLRSFQPPEATHMMARQVVVD